MALAACHWRWLAIWQRHGCWQLAAGSRRPKARISRLGAARAGGLRRCTAQLLPLRFAEGRLYVVALQMRRPARANGALAAASAREQPPGPRVAVRQRPHAPSTLPNLASTARKKPYPACGAGGLRTSPRPRWRALGLASAGGWGEIGGRTTLSDRLGGFYCSCHKVTEWFLRVGTLAERGAEKPQPSVPTGSFTRHLGARSGRGSRFSMP